MAVTALTVTGCADPGNPAATRSPGSPTPTRSTTEQASDYTACSDLVASGWTAPPTDPDLSYDPETGRAVVTYTDEQLVLNFLTDTACASVPDLAPLVRAALAYDGN